MKSIFRMMLVCVASVVTMAVHAQGWPTKPVKVVAVFPPGGSVDTVARILSHQLTKQLGQQFMVDNKGGASGSIGTAFVAKAPPDGYTFAVVFDTHGVNSSIIPNLSYDTLKDLAPVMMVGTSPMVIARHPAVAYTDFKQVIAAGKQKADAVSFGSIGSGSLGHLAMTQIANLANTTFNHIPYKGGGPLVQDAIAGHVPLMIGTIFLAKPQIDAKMLVPLAVTSAKRSAKLPDVPTVAEQGVPGFESVAWWGVVAPAGTPPAIIARLNEELVKALKTPEVAEKLSAQGMDIVGSKPEVLQSFLQAEISRWAKVVKDNKIKAGE
ncbi:MAG: tripartite tricarboxylate transporter substrate binding protein [Betaproteobacteria bacterium]|nr:tripartite tricarboxylate transporter substrate binding protein [Betaproteobacteria bacterium]